MNSNNNVPKYQMIIDDIIDRIQRNDFSYDVPICTEQSLMEEYGVSRITVTRALTELLQRGVIYRKRGVGSFVTKTFSLNNEPLSVPVAAPKTVSFLVPFDLTTPLVSEIVKIVAEQLNRSGYFMNVYVCNASSSQEKANLKLLLSQNVAGIVYLPFRDKVFVSLLNEFVIQGKPVIVIDKYTDCPYIHNITSDNFEGGRLLTDHLISLGHRNIAFFTTAPLDEVSTVRNRFGGYLHALHHGGILPSPSNLVQIFCDLGNEAPEDFPNYQIVSFLRKCQQNGTTAILTENEIVADYLCRTCQYLGIRIPEDMSICGFDDTDLSKRFPGGITTIRQDHVSIANEILSILNEALVQPSVDICHKSVPVSLIVRGSTGPNRSAR